MIAKDKVAHSWLHRAHHSNVRWGCTMPNVARFFASHETSPPGGTPVGTWHHDNLSYSRRTAASMMASAQWSTLLAPHSVQTPTWMITRQNTYPLSVRWRKATSCLRLIARPRLQKAQAYSSLWLAMLLNRVWAVGWGSFCSKRGAGTCEPIHTWQHSPSRRPLAADSASTFELDHPRPDVVRKRNHNQSSGHHKLQTA